MSVGSGRIPVESLVFTIDPLNLKSHGILLSNSGTGSFITYSEFAMNTSVGYYPYLPALSGDKYSAFHSYFNLSPITFNLSGGLLLSHLLLIMLIMTHHKVLRFFLGILTVLVI